jgi:hypothetical protein
MSRAAHAAMLLVGALVAAPPAAAQSSPDAPDANSPAGVEYQLPLQTGRQEGAGRGKPKGDVSHGRGGTRPSSGEPPLFGAGIKPRSTSRHARTHAEHGDTKPAKRGRHKPRGSPRIASSDVPAVTRQPVSAVDSGGAGGTSTLVIVLAAAVVLIGAAAGFGLKRVFSNPA